MSLFTFLNKPYPFLKTTYEKWLFSFIAGISVFLFLYIYEPFGIVNIYKNKFIYLLGYFVITFTFVCVHFFSVGAILRWRNKKKNFTVKYHLLLIFSIVTWIGLANWVYFNFTFEIYFMNGLYYSLVPFMIKTYAVSIIPCVISYYFLGKSYRAKMQKKMLETLDARFFKDATSTNDPIYQIGSANLNDVLSLRLSQIICIASERNYVYVYFLKETRIKRHLLRTSLNKLSQQFEKEYALQRCHRSFMVNIDHIKRISGQTKHYYFHLEAMPFKVPVSRNFPRIFIQRIKKKINSL